MSDTPRTDAIRNYLDTVPYSAQAAIAELNKFIERHEQLERELAAMTKERDNAIKQRDVADLERSYCVVELWEIGELVGIEDNDIMAVKHAVGTKLDAARAALKEAMKGPVVDAETWARWNKALGEEDGI